MTSLDAVLGQGALASRVLDTLKDPNVVTARLSGPSGSGKSYVAGHVASRWQEAGGRTVLAVGDADNASRSLYPLLSGLAAARGDWSALAGTAARSTVVVTEAALGSPGAGVSIFDLLGAAFRQRTARALRPFGEAERAVILELNALCRGHSVLVVADNAHWWDFDSLRLLQGLAGDHLRESVPHLQQLKVLVVDTSVEQKVVAPEVFHAVVDACGERALTLDRPSRQILPEILRSFGYDRPVPDDVLRLLFDVTGGHLKLLEQLAAILASSHVDAVEAILDSSDVRSIVDARFGSLGVARPDVASLLVRAAVLGLSCGNRDLECLAGQKRAQVLELLEKAEAIGFVGRHAGRITFSHDVIRSALLSSDAAGRLGPLYEKLADCLAMLRPGDYAARARALTMAEDPEGAREFIALAAVAQMRRGVSLSQGAGVMSAQIPADEDLEAYCATIADAHAAIKAGDFSRIIPRLRTPLAGETTLMAAERSYLAAICLMELQTTACAREAQAVLAAWDSRLESEAELAIRFLLLRQQAQVLANMVDEARSTESEIEQRLLDRRAYDLDAAVMLQVQNRRAAAVNVPEVSEFRIAEAVRFFRRGTGEPARDRLELLRSLNNLASVKIRVGKFQEAYEHARETERLAADEPEAVNRLDVIASNLILAGLRSGDYDLDQAIERQRLVVESPEGANDSVLQRCNLAGYLLLAGHDADAGKLLDELDAEVRDGDFDESYLLFYLEATIVAGAVFRGDVDEAVDRHAAQKDFVEALSWPGAPYVRRRHVRVAAALPNLTAKTPREELDRLLLNGRPEIGAAWDYYARLVPSCSLNFWSDS